MTVTVNENNLSFHQLFSYVNSVLVPEAIIYLVMEFYGLGYLEVIPTLWQLFAVILTETIQAEQKMRKNYEDEVMLCGKGRYSMFAVWLTSLLLTLQAYSQMVNLQSTAV